MYYTKPGRPPELKNPRYVGVKIEKEHYDMLNEIANKKGVSVSAIIREAIAEYLKRERKLKGDNKEEDKDSSEIEEVLRRNRILKLEARLSKLWEEYRKARYVTIVRGSYPETKSIEEIVNLAKDPRMQKDKHKVDSRYYETPIETLSRKRDELLAFLEKVDVIVREALRLGANKVANEGKELSSEISKDLASILNALKDLSK